MNTGTYGIRCTAGAHFNLTSTYTYAMYIPSLHPRPMYGTYEDVNRDALAASFGGHRRAPIRWAQFGPFTAMSIELTPVVVC
jgi:hypothetical protein